MYIPDSSTKRSIIDVEWIFLKDLYQMQNDAKKKKSDKFRGEWTAKNATSMLPEPKIRMGLGPSMSTQLTI
jgi:hypothetical protein